MIQFKFSIHSLGDARGRPLRRPRVLPAAGGLRARPRARGAPEPLGPRRGVERRVGGRGADLEGKPKGRRGHQ